jgi:signal transduction histidine kinase
MASDVRALLHELNNVLAVVVSYAELLEAEIPEDDARRADAVEIEQAARRAATIAVELRTLLPR